MSKTKENFKKNLKAEIHQLEINKGRLKKTDHLMTLIKKMGGYLAKITNS